MLGKVIRKIQGFYFVYTFYNFNSIEEFEEKLIKCKLRGSLKTKNKKDNCMIGDIVDIDNNLEIIENIHERKNFLLRPLISNIDYIAISFAYKNPDFDFLQLQRILLNIHKNNIPIILILTKSDLINNEEKDNIINTLNKNFPYLKIFSISINKKENLNNLIEFIKNKNVVISGSSGVGKSTLINTLLGFNILKTNDVSTKTKKGKNTTVDTRFFPYKNGYIIDTPGFSSIEIPNIKNILDIKDYFPEINELSKKCKFKNCIHISEPNCNVKYNLNDMRYDFYKDIVNHIKKNGGY